MLKTKHLLFIFLPAILIAAFVLFIRVVQYRPLYPKVSTTTSTTEATLVPIFADDPITGKRDAPVTIEVFEDFGCAHCHDNYELLNQIYQKYPDKIKIVWKALPVTKFPYSTELAHQNAYCAGQQGKFFDFANLAFSNSSNLNQDTINNIVTQINLDTNDLKKCLATKNADIYLQSVLNLATSLNIQVVPTIFLNNEQIETPELAEQWDSLIQNALNQQI